MIVMALVKDVRVRIQAEGVEDAQLKIGKIRAAAEELKAVNPKITPTIDSTRALLEARLLKEGIKRELAGALDIPALSAGQGSGVAGLLKSVFGVGESSFASGVPFIGQGGIYGIGAAVAATGAVLNELVAVASGLAAAGAGAGAFFLLAHHQAGQLLQDFQQVQTAND